MPRSDLSQRLISLYESEAVSRPVAEATSSNICSILSSPGYTSEEVACPRNYSSGKSRPMRNLTNRLSIACGELQAAEGSQPSFDSGAEWWLNGETRLLVT